MVYSTQEGCELFRGAFPFHLIAHYISSSVLPTCGMRKLQQTVVQAIPAYAAIPTYVIVEKNAILYSNQVLRRTSKHISRIFTDLNNHATVVTIIIHLYMLYFVCVLHFYITHRTITTRIKRVVMNLSLPKHARECDKQRHIYFPNTKQLGIKNFTCN